MLSLPKSIKKYTFQTDKSQSQKVAEVKKSSDGGDVERVIPISFGK